MLRYDKNNVEELKVFLYNSYVHDAIIENVIFNCREDKIEIELFNPISNVNMHFTFLDIAIVLKIQGEWAGSPETIISLTVEDDCSYLQKYLRKHCCHTEEALYLLFQMFSGDELHIVSKEVFIEM